MKPGRCATCFPRVFSSVQRLVELAAVHLRPRAGDEAAERKVGMVGRNDGDLVEQRYRLVQSDSSTARSAAVTWISSATSSSSRNTSVTGGRSVVSVATDE